MPGAAPCELADERSVCPYMSGSIRHSSRRPRPHGWARPPYGDGRPRPAFEGGDGGGSLLIALVRRGWDDEEAAHGSLQRVEYRLREGRIERWSFAAVDGETQRVAAPLIAGVRQVRLRYRDREGLWRANWDPTDAAALPVAVELVTDSAGQGVLRQLFLVGSRR